MPDLDTLTVAAVSSALDAASLRQQVIAANIANAGRAGYVAQRVTFTTMFGWAHMAAAGRTSDAAAGLRPTPGPIARIEPDLDAEGAPRAVELDAEVGELARNSTHYQALLRGLNRHLQVLASAVSEGKR